jgi:hypothetical protein
MLSPRDVRRDANGGQAPKMRALANLWTVSSKGAVTLKNSWVARVAFEDQAGPAGAAFPTTRFDATRTGGPA